LLGKSKRLKARAPVSKGVKSACAGAFLYSLTCPQFLGLRMKKTVLTVPISELYPAPEAGPPPGWNKPLPAFQDLGGGAELAQWRATRLNLRISGLAAARLEALSYRMGNPNVNPVAKALLEASAGVEAADFYGLLATITQYVQESARRAGR